VARLVQDARLPDVFEIADIREQRGHDGSGDISSADALTADPAGLLL
jgi:hypothetical protein